MMIEITFWVFRLSTFGKPLLEIVLMKDMFPDLPPPLISSETTESDSAQRWQSLF